MNFRYIIDFEIKITKITVFHHEIVVNALLIENKVFHSEGKLLFSVHEFSEYELLGLLKI